MTTMVEARHFDTLPAEVEEKPTKRNPRKGAAFIAVEDESKSEGEDEKSALPNLKELLREQGYIQLNVGAEKAWDGDAVSEFGFGWLHVGRARASPEPNGVVFAGAGDELIGSPSEGDSTSRCRRRELKRGRRRKVGTAERRRAAA